MARRKVRVWAKTSRCMGYYDVQVSYPDLESAHKAGQEAIRLGYWEYYVVNGLKIQDVLDAKTFKKTPAMSEDQYKAILRVL